MTDINAEAMDDYTVIVTIESAEPKDGSVVIRLSETQAHSLHNKLWGALLDVAIARGDGPFGPEPF